MRGDGLPVLAKLLHQPEQLLVILVPPEGLRVVLKPLVPTIAHLLVPPGQLGRYLLPLHVVLVPALQKQVVLLLRPQSLTDRTLRRQLQVLPRQYEVLFERRAFFDDFLLLGRNLSGNGLRRFC